MPNSQAPLLLLRIDPNKNMRRFYAMTVQPNLFGGSSLVRTWGRIGNNGQLKVELFEDKATALRARDRLALAKQRRGYITQAEGNESSSS